MNLRQTMRHNEMPQNSWNYMFIATCLCMIITLHGPRINKSIEMFVKSHWHVLLNYSLCVVIIIFFDIRWRHGHGPKKSKKNEIQKHDITETNKKLPYILFPIIPSRFMSFGLSGAGSDRAGKASHLAAGANALFCVMHLLPGSWWLAKYRLFGFSGICY